VKKVVSAALIMFVLAGFTVGTARAQLSTVTSFQVQNLSGDTASVEIKFYDATSGDEVSAATVSDTIAGNSSKLYTQANNEDLPTGFSGSVVVSSDKQVAAMGVQKTSNDDDSRQYQGTYGAFSGSQASDAFYIPIVMRAFYGYHTEISVQNAGSSNADVTINYNDGSSDSENGLKPGQVVRFDNRDTSGMEDGFIGSAEISANGPVVAVVNQIHPDNLEEQTYEGFSTVNAGDTLYTPVLMRYFYDYVTSVRVQKIGSGSTDVTIEYSNGYSDTQTLTDESDSYLFTQENEDNLPRPWIGSAVIESTSNDIIAVVNQQNLDTGKAASYNAAAGGATRAVGPNVMKTFYDFNTSVQVQNLGSETTCTATFSNGTSQDSTSLGQYETYLFTQQNNADLPDAWTGSVDITCGGESFVAVINQEGATGSGDTQMAYNGMAAGE
jgi:hypothetical protein